MKNKIVIVLIICIGIVPNISLATVSFLTNEWIQNGDQICRYDDGSEINVGVRLCPLSRDTTKSRVPESRSSLKYYLEKEWIQGGDQMCRYENGTVLNVGVRLCPLSIQ